MEAFEFIGNAILFIGSLIVIAIVWGFLMNGMSKIFNTRITYRGTTVGHPDEFDRDIETITKVKNAAINRIKDSVNSFITRNSATNNVSEKLRLLQELEDLKSSQILSETEYHDLRNEILK